MVPFSPVQVVHNLILVENGALWAVGVWSNLNIEIVLDQDIRELIEARIFEVAARHNLAETVVRQAQFIGDRRRKRVEFR